MNLTYMTLRNGLMNGTISSASLQALLTGTAAYASAFEAMCGHKSSVDMLTNSSQAMATIQGSGRAIATMLSKEVGYVNMIASPFFIQPGGAGTKLGRNVFTSSGTWTYPGALSDLMVLLIGGGGSGAISFSSSNYATGGGGGEILAKKLTGVVANQTVTIGTGGTKSSTIAANGTAGGSSSFGSLATAAGGGAGVYNASAYVSAAGGGTTTQASWLDKNWTTAFWQPVLDVVGGASQTGCQYTYYRQAIDATRTFTLGTAGAQQGGAGTGYAAGGGNVYGTSSQQGASAAANSGCGGGATVASSGTANAGQGGSGLVVVYYTLA